MFSVSEILNWTGGRVVNGDSLDPARVQSLKVERPSSLGTSKQNEIAFFFSKNYQHELPSARAGILITGEAFVQPLSAAGLPLWKSTVVIACRDPYLAMAVLSEKFAIKLSSVSHSLSEEVAQAAELAGKPDIHPTAVIHPTADLGAGVRVGAHVVIEENARIGIGTVIYPGCYIGPGCVIGDYCVLFPNVVLYEWTQLGNRVRIHASSVLGADGFGYAPRTETKDGQTRVLEHQKIYHLGRTVIGDDVELGAGTTVDRGTIADTRVERGVKIDDQVHLGHNVHVDEGAVICGGVCLAGNASVGKFAYILGMAGVINQIHVGDGAQVGAMTLVSKDVQPGETVVGNPQREQREHFRAHAWLSKMSRKPSATSGEGKK